MRFNRTLLIKSSNGFSDLFRPYHPSDLTSRKERFLWSNSGTWSGYDAFIESVRSANDGFISPNNVYNLSNCVSNTLEGLSEIQTQKCAMETGDVVESIVEFASNRAYLCRYFNESRIQADINKQSRIEGNNENLSAPKSIAAEQLTNVLGISEADDFFEIGGCIGRLVMWPRQKLWDEVDRVLAKQLNQTTNSDDDDDDEDEEPSFSGNINLDMDIYGDIESGQDLDHSTAVMNSFSGTPFTEQLNPPFILSIHHRCGDLWSYYPQLDVESSTKNIQVFKYNVQHPSACLASKDLVENEKEFDDMKRKTSKYLLAGTPEGLAKCAKLLMDK